MIIFRRKIQFLTGIICWAITYTESAIMAIILYIRDIISSR